MKESMREFAVLDNKTGEASFISRDEARWLYLQIAGTTEDSFDSFCAQGNVGCKSNGTILVHYHL